jgi:hypothetical protein
MKDSREISACAPELQKLGYELIARYWKRFAPFYLLPTFTSRSQQTHDALWAQGRMGTAAVNSLRMLAGLQSITDEENKRQVTRTKRSKHLLNPSQAIDFAVTIDPDGPTGPLKPVIDWEDEGRYAAMGAMAEELGLAWGGKWGDSCHVELAPPKETKV